jgi:hypothetical protein
MLPVAIEERLKEHLRLGLAVRVSGVEDLSRSAVGSAHSISSARIGGAEGGGGGGAALRDYEACRAAQLPALIRDASSRGRLRHSDRARVARAFRRQHDDDVFARAESWRAWGSESIRPVVTVRRLGETRRSRTTAPRPARAPELQSIHDTALAA